MPSLTIILGIVAMKKLLFGTAATVGAGTALICGRRKSAELAEQRQACGAAALATRVVVAPILPPSTEPPSTSLLPVIAAPEPVASLPPKTVTARVSRWRAWWLKAKKAPAKSVSWVKVAPKQAMVTTVLFFVELIVLLCKGIKGVIAKLKGDKHSVYPGLPIGWLTPQLEASSCREWALRPALGSRAP